MLAEALEPDVLVQDHLVILFGKGLLEVDSRVEVQTPEYLGVHPGDAIGGIGKSLPVGILAHREQNLAPARRIRSRSTDGDRATAVAAPSSASSQPWAEPLQAV